MSAAAYDVAVIGGGIVGMATAMALSGRARLRLIVVEAEERIAAHQSGNNSGVIHSGIYYKPGSLKARNCVASREALYRFCAEQGIAYTQCGKLIVATTATEVAALDEVKRRGDANGIQGVRRLSADELTDYEPHVTGLAGLWVPVTGIVDYREVTAAFARILQEKGGVIWTGARVEGIQRRHDETQLRTARGDVRCRYVINCAGLQSDRVARMCGVEPGVQIIPFRGEYYDLIPERRGLVRGLIYPVPDPRFPFLGAHFTRMVGGGVEAGPNAVLAFKREGYRWKDISPRDLFGMTTYAGFWRMVLRYGSTGFAEMCRSVYKPAFVRALQRLIPELRSSDLVPGGAGVRAQAVDPSGALVDDFRIVASERMIHVLNAPSPAATASLSIGETIADMAVKRFDLPAV